MNQERKEILEHAAGKVALEFVKQSKLFRAVYNGKQFAEIEYDQQFECEET